MEWNGMEYRLIKYIFDGFFMLGFIHFFVYSTVTHHQCNISGIAHQIRSTALTHRLGRGKDQARRKGICYINNYA